MVIGLFLGVWERWLGMKVFGGSMRAPVFGTRVNDIEEIFRKREVGTDRLVSFGVVPWVLAESWNDNKYPFSQEFLPLWSYFGQPGGWQISAFSNQINIIKYLQSGQEMIFLGFFVCLVLFPEKNTVDKREREEMSLGAGRAARFIMLLIV